MDRLAKPPWRPELPASEWKLCECGYVVACVCMVAVWLLVVVCGCLWLFGVKDACAKRTLSTNTC